MQSFEFTILSYYRNVDFLQKDRLSTIAYNSKDSCCTKSYAKKTLLKSKKPLYKVIE